MKDEQLVKQFQTGDHRSFDELMRRYQEKVLNTCYRFIGQEDEARDATQDIFVKVYWALDSFKPKAKFSTWLYRIAVNHSLNVVRSKKRRAWMKRLNLMGGEKYEIGLIPDHANNPENVIEQQEQSKLVQSMLNALKEEQRIALVLHRFEGLSYKEIAKVMNISVSAVESRIFRARQKLAILLNKLES